MKILIKNATVVSSENTVKSDILIDLGIIQKIEKNILAKDVDKIIDATGLFVFPGGIDPHVHLNLPTHAGFSADDFYTGSKAALFGGTTSIIDFVTPEKGQSLPKALELRKIEAENSLIDYSFHVSPIDWNENTETEIQEIIKLGINSFKVYMAYVIGLNDSDLLKVLQAVAKAGGMITVHAELGDEIEKYRDKLFLENKITPKFHPISRPSNTESEAVKHVIELANKANCPLYIVHVSTKESVKYIEEAQAKGQKVYGETCPQYLVLDDSKLKGKFENTAAFVFSPPLRKVEDNIVLWDAINNNTIQTIGTDHCPFSYKQKQLGENDFRKIPNGAGGIEHRLAILYTYGVLENKISINKMVDVFSTSPAKIFGLYPQKGNIAVGSITDLVIWNPDSENIISTKTHHQNCDLNIYDGFKTRGNCEFVILGGEIVIENNKLLVEKKGRFLKRDKID